MGNNQKGDPGLGETPFVVCVKITTPERVSYLAEQNLNKDQKLHFEEDGSLIITMTVQNFSETVSWVLSMGSGAEVLMPQWLRHAVAREVALLHWRYTGEGKDFVFAGELPTETPDIFLLNLGGPRDSGTWFSTPLPPKDCTLGEPKQVQGRVLPFSGRTRKKLK